MFAVGLYAGALFVGAGETAQDSHQRQSGQDSYERAEPLFDRLRHHEPLKSPAVRPCILTYRACHVLFSLVKTSPVIEVRRSLRVSYHMRFG